MATAPTIGRGRPTKIDEVVGHRQAVGPDGHVSQVPVTVSERLLERVSIGLDLTDACESANITRQTLHNWRREGANVRAKQAQGKRLGTKEQRKVDFLDALERVEAEAELRKLAIIEGCARGGGTVTKETVKTSAIRDKEGNETGTYEVERTVVTETMAPLWTAAAWWLERRKPAKYARRVEVSGPNGGAIPIEQRARTLAEQARAMLEANAQGAAAEVRATEALTSEDA